MSLPPISSETSCRAENRRDAWAPQPEERERLLRAWRDSLEGEFRIDQYTRLAREIEERLPPGDLPPFRVLVVSTFTIQNVEPILRVLCYLEGLAPRIEFAPPNQIEQTLLSTAEPRDLVIVATQAEDLAPRLFDRGLDPEAHGDVSVAELKDRVARLTALAHERTRGVVLVHNFIVPTDRTFGILEPRVRETPASLARELNRFLEELSRQQPFLHVVDVERLAALHGKAAWRDPRFWYTGRLALVNRPARMVVDEYVRFIRAMRGRVPKCLVLDCDNTLWGGAIGEDGIGGIQLGGDYPGICYLELQREILALFHRGVLLALNSKNNEADVLEALDRHPAMLIRRSHLAAYRVNWQDKATNLVEIARELGIGLESLVYADDDPAEVEQVRQALPEVATIHLGSTPVDLLPRFREGARFDLLAFTEEDRIRSRTYREQHRRDELRRSVASLDQFHQQLQMRASMRPLSSTDIPRASQLSQRTNQFNLTTRRYSEADIARLLESGRHRLFAVSLEDKFGDYGTVGLLILSPVDREILEIDTFLLSCRVIGRTLEQTMLAHALEVARRDGYRTVRGRYLPTSKNALVKELYPRFGFAPVDDDGAVWERACAAGIPYSPWIQLDVAGAGPSASRPHG